MVNKTANAMRDLGVRIEDRVMILMLDVPQFYWRKREKTRQTMQGEWINTGDKYYGDKEGYYWCAGRADDMLKVGGDMGFTRRSRKLSGYPPSGPRERRGGFQRRSRADQTQGIRRAP